MGAHHTAQSARIPCHHFRRGPLKGLTSDFFTHVEQAIYWYTWCARPLPVHGFVEIPNVSLVEYKPLADWRCDICKAHTTGQSGITQHVRDVHRHTTQTTLASRLFASVLNDIRTSKAVLYLLHREKAGAWTWVMVFEWMIDDEQHSKSPEFYYEEDAHDWFRHHWKPWFDTGSLAAPLPPATHNVGQSGCRSPAYPHSLSRHAQLLQAKQASSARGGRCSILTSSCLVAHPRAGLSGRGSCGLPSYSCGHAVLTTCHCEPCASARFPSARPCGSSPPLLR